MENFKILKAPSREKPVSGSKRIFLAGSIDIGEAENWQEELEGFLKDCSEKNDKKITVYNPRRDDWDSEWQQSIENTQFFEQVSWELDNIEKADLTIIHFSKDSKAPITLLELGKAVESGKSTLVYCPEGYHRKGNVDIVCYRKDVPVASTLDEFKQMICEYLNVPFDGEAEDTETEEPEEVKESVEQAANKVMIKSFSDNPILEYATGEDNIIIVEDFERIEDSCMMGKLSFMGREIYGGICTENNVSKIHLKVYLEDLREERNLQFLIQKATESSPEGIVLAE